MTTKSRVFLLVSLSEWGGAQHIVYLLATQLRTSYDITVGCAPGGELVERLRQQGVRVVEITGLRRFPYPWWDLRALWQIYRLMRREKFDLVHAHSTKAGLLGRLAAKLAGVPAVLFTAHGWAFTEGRAWWKRQILAWYERAMGRLTTRIICVSEHDRQLALQFKVAPVGRLVVIHNGVAPEPFSKVHRAKVRAQLGIGDVPVITFVGRLASPKDLMTLLGAFEKLPASRLIVVGEGPLRPKVERIVEQKQLGNRVILLGSRTDIPEILAASDIFVLSSCWEGLPLTIIEAMMAGLPVVATQVGGVPELVEDGVTGLLVPREDPEALAKAIQELLDDKELCRRMGQTGREKALRHFTLERMLSATKKIYEEVVGGMSE